MPGVKQSGGGMRLSGQYLQCLGDAPPQNSCFMISSVNTQMAAYKYRKGVSISNPLINF